MAAMGVEAAPDEDLRLQLIEEGRKEAFARKKFLTIVFGQCKKFMHKKTKYFRRRRAGFLGLEGASVGAHQAGVLAGEKPLGMRCWQALD